MPARVNVVNFGCLTVDRREDDAIQYNPMGSGGIPGQAWSARWVFLRNRGLMMGENSPAADQPDMNRPPAPTRMTAVIPADTRYLQFLASVTRDFCRMAVEGIPDIDEQFFFNIELVMTEAVVNAIRHAYQGTEGPVELTLDWADYRLSILVSDHGVPFTDFDSHAAMEVDELDPMSTGGRGIMIIRSLMDHVNYSMDDKTGRNELRMVKKFPRPDTPGSDG